ncbi:MAG: hypothetical protein GXP30_13775 [Verrucomicrobia bacterium]|nr:hypothetical protein [Verrucomicrobiota bacterium]
MADSQKQKLINLGVDQLADALLELSHQSEAAADLIKRLTVAPKDNIQRFKKKLSAIKSEQNFYHWKNSRGFLSRIERLLQDLEAGVTDPLSGLELVRSFYEADSKIFEQCDDSGGGVGEIFRYTAKDLFAKYAALCEDKKKVASIMLELNQNDGYGVRDAVFENAADFLPEAVIRSMITKLQNRADNEKVDHAKRHYFHLIETLARQIKDAELFEQTRKASWENLNPVAYLDIAQVYLESGDTKTATTWLNEIPDKDSFHSYQKNKLLAEIYTQAGDQTKLAELLHQKFETCPSSNSLSELLDVIGEEKREAVITKQVSRILEQSAWCESNAAFLIAIGKMDEAEKYLLKRANQLDGNYYSGLLPLAEKMELKHRHLAASLLYRPLLTSILDRGYSKAYRHAVAYLEKLDQLAPSIKEWQNFPDHQKFKDQIRQKHRLKRGFWGRYDDKA